MRCRLDMSDLVERPTGWPRHKCRELIRILNRRHWLTAFVLPTVAALGFAWAWMYSYAAIVQMLENRGVDLFRWALQAPWLRLPLLYAGGMGVAFTGCAVISVTIGRQYLRRHIARYLAAPTCLACRYPIAPEAARCPECGSAIPAHLADWVRRR